MAASGPPSAESRAVRFGAVLWVLSAVALVGQVVAAAAWQAPRYSWTDHAISDLGVTACGRYHDLGGVVRTICSPWHPVFTIAMVLAGLFVAVGGWLLRSAWSTRPTRIALVLMVPAGLAVAAVGAMPWDLLPDLHDLAATAQWLLQLVAMVLCVTLVRDGRPGSRLLAVGTLGAVLVSVVGFGLFIAGPTAQSVIGWGLAERLAFDVLTLWTIAVGAHVLVRQPHRVPAG